MLAWIAEGERLDRFDEPFARVVREARGHEPVARASLSETIGDRYWTVLRAAIERARARGSARSMLHGFGPEGRSLDVTVTADSASGEIMLALAPLSETDATDEASFSSALHGNLTEMIAVFDRELRIRGFNAAYAAGARAVLGRDLVAGDTFREVVHPDTAPRWEALCQRALDGESFIEDFVAELAIGLVHTYEVSLNPVRDARGAILGGVMISRNVTERRRATLEATTRADRQRAMLEAVPDSITTIDRAGKITSYKPGRDETGVEGPLGSHIRDLPHTPGAHLAELLEPVFGAGEPVRLDYEIVTDGTLRHRTGWLQRIDDDAAVWVARDVTEELAGAQRLAYTDRMASIGALAAGVAHEVNNPLQYVLTNLEIAEERLATVSPEVRELVSESLEGVRRVCGVVSSLRAFSVWPDAEPAAVDVADAVRAAIAIVKPRLTIARLEVDLEATGRVLAVQKHLEQVFVALLLNAADAIEGATANGGRVTIRTRRLGDDRVVVEIGDDGPGIDARTRRRMFDPFFTTKPVGRGTGLGLTVSLHTVRAAGGTIDVETAPGEGTTMRVVLPLTAAVRGAR